MVVTNSLLELQKEWLFAPGICCVLPVHAHNHAIVQPRPAARLLRVHDLIPLLGEFAVPLSPELINASMDWAPTGALTPFSFRAEDSPEGVALGGRSIVPLVHVRVTTPAAEPPATELEPALL